MPNLSAAMESAPRTGRILALEAVVGGTVVLILLSKQYGGAATVAFSFAAVAVGFTGLMVARLVRALSDPGLDVVGKVRDFATERLEAEKQVVLLGIRDLELEYATGKMDEANYRSLRTSAEAKAANIISELQQQDRLWRKRAEQLVTSRLGTQEPPKSKEAEEVSAPSVSASAAASRPCEYCGFVSPPTAKFCGGCGRAKEQVA